MQERTWKVGQKYRLVDVTGFVKNNYMNEKITSILVQGFVVDAVNPYGKVNRIEGNPKPEGFFHWLEADEIEFFEEVDEVQDNTTDAVVEWLNKFLAVAKASSTYESVGLTPNDDNRLCLETMHGDVYEPINIVNTINTRYAEQAIETKRNQLIEEVAKAKAEYDAKVAELELLEGK